MSHAGAHDSVAASIIGHTEHHWIQIPRNKLINTYDARQLVTCFVCNARRSAAVLCQMHTTKRWTESLRINVIQRIVVLPWASGCAPSLTVKMEEMENEGSPIHASSFPFFFNSSYNNDRAAPAGQV